MVIGQPVLPLVFHFCGPHSSHVTVVIADPRPEMVADRK